MKVSVFLTILSSVTSALAGCNCKCQDPSGTGPQWDDLTYEACSVQLPDESAACLMNKVYHGQEHHQRWLRQVLQGPRRPWCFLLEVRGYYICLKLGSISHWWLSMVALRKAGRRPVSEVA
ncbi:hypothetical protein B0H65DRAFT_441241 [Neurospora tetraspora]|uniref:Secreted protein n=1 Tax=Neurospora tetraspora TaxID=94610 RepID=A0AAE0MSY2_9PEZI|nr:hypothetical protein B0H65DRAFT_441241 [Neurospora tetraspora]